MDRSTLADGGGMKQETNSEQCLVCGKIGIKEVIEYKKCCYCGAFAAMHWLGDLGISCHLCYGARKVPLPIEEV